MYKGKIIIALPGMGDAMPFTTSTPEKIKFVNVKNMTPSVDNVSNPNFFPFNARVSLGTVLLSIKNKPLSAVAKKILNRINHRLTWGV